MQTTRQQLWNTDHLEAYSKLPFWEDASEADR